MFKKQNTIGYLEGIRGVAALGVFLNHFSLAFYNACLTQNPLQSHLNNFEMDYSHSLFSFINNGNFCVAVFFVLSGYVLSRKYYLTDDIEVLISGLHRRFIRLYIPIAFTLIVSGILMAGHFYYNEPTGQITLSGWFIKQWHFEEAGRRFLASFFYSTMFVGDNKFDTSLWTISYELYGSFFVFAFLMFTHYTKRFRLAMMFLATYFFFVMQGVMNGAFYIEFILGMTLFSTEKKIEKMNPAIASITGVALLALGLILGSMPFYAPFPDSWQDNIKTNTWDYTPWCLTVAAYFLVVAFMLTRILQKIISTLPFRFLGYVSFSLYLIHPLILGSFTGFVFLRLYDNSNDYNQSALIAFLLTIAVLLPLSWLMAKYVDQFGIRLAKRVYDYVKDPAIIAKKAGKDNQ